MKPVTISSIDLARGVVDGLICVYKRRGETPLESLGRLRELYPILNDIPLSYAGRLDPLAEGVLLVLSGAYNKRREEFLSLDKVYEVEVLTGVATDTGDTLGLVTYFNPVDISDDLFKTICNSFVGTYTSTYPAYSSKTVNGVPLHVLAKEGKISEVELPTFTSYIHSIEYVESRSVSMVDVLSIIENTHALVSGEFRQGPILDSWKKCTHSEVLKAFRIRVSASSGTYMRTLANDISKKCGSEGIAFHIKRTRIGQFDISDCIDL
ncbi:MAG: hypothetical protein FGM57_00230 [Candidatus Taylorbacteria bacterium]|nr:hypothetical protein [Candidatus Taylorbacteria bacterium]